GTVNLAEQPFDLRRQAVPPVERQRFHRRAIGSGADPGDVQRRKCPESGSLGHGTPHPLGRGRLGRRDIPARRRGRGAAAAALALGSWLAFQPHDRDTVVMGDLVLTAEEVTPVISALLDGGIQVTAVHNHLLRSTPATYYVHVRGEGDPAKLAVSLHAALARS